MRKRFLPVVAGGVAASLAGLGLLPGTAVPAQARGSGCAHGGEACLQTFDDGLYVGDVQVRFTHSDTINGHAHIYGAGYSYDTPNQRLVGGFCAQGRCNPTTQQFTFHVRRSFPDGSLFCAEIWQQDGGGYYLRGRPCLTIHG